MSTTVTRPEITEILDWEIELPTGSKPLRYLNVSELHRHAQIQLRRGRLATAAVFASLQLAIDTDGGIVDDLTDDAIQAAIWRAGEGELIDLG